MLRGTVAEERSLPYLLADFRAQSPSLAVTLWRTVRANDAKATAFSGRCERVAPFEPLTLITPDASRDSRRYRGTKPYLDAFGGPRNR
jgi:hypothetical protein